MIRNLTVKELANAISLALPFLDKSFTQCRDVLLVGDAETKEVNIYSTDRYNIIKINLSAEASEDFRLTLRTDSLKTLASVLKTIKDREKQVLINHYDSFDKIISVDIEGLNTNVEIRFEGYPQVENLFQNSLKKLAVTKGVSFQLMPTELKSLAKLAAIKGMPSLIFKHVGKPESGYLYAVPVSDAATDFELFLCLRNQDAKG